MGEGLRSVRKDGGRQRRAWLVVLSFFSLPGAAVNSPKQSPVPTQTLWAWGKNYSYGLGLQYPWRSTCWRPGYQPSVESGRKRSHWDVPLKGISGLQATSCLSLFISCFPGSQQQFYHTLFATTDFSTTGPKAMHQITMDWSPWNHKENRPSLFISFSAWAFCHSDGKLTQLSMHRLNLNSRLSPFW